MDHTWTSIWPDPTQQETPRETDLPETAEDVVVGAGLTGMVTALLLARAGRRVVVLEARDVGAVTTGHSTAKVSVLQGTRLSRVLRHHPVEVARAYVEANREGQAWTRRFGEDHGVVLDVRPAVTFAATASERRAVEQEHAAAERVGLPVRWTEELDVPFPVHGATVLDEQAQVDPRALLAALVDETRRHGGEVHVGHRVTGVHASSDGVRLALDDGRELRAGRAVLGTGMPVLDRGLYFAMAEPRRSYGLAVAGAASPRMMLLSAGSSSRSVRDATVDGREVLVLGGAGHAVGRTSSEASHVAALRSWAQQWFPGHDELARWSAQDYSSFDGVPVVGLVPRSHGRVWAATGYGAWGMTNGPAAALAIVGEMLGSRPSWATTLQRRRVGLRGAASLAVINAQVAAQAVNGVVRSLRPAGLPGPEGEPGRVGRSAGLQPTARARTEGEDCALSARCTHLGGVLRWNDAESTWDCPWHGSRFATDGQVLEGPATRPLRPR